MKRSQNRSKRASMSITRKEVRQMIASKMEIKHDVGTSAAATSTSGNIIYISNPSQGADTSGRSGDRIYPLSLRVRLAMQDSTSNSTRLIIVQDTEAYGAAPTVTNILASANYNATYNAVNLINGRFKFLLDTALNFSTAGDQFQYLDRTIKLKGYIGYVGTDNTVSSAGKNSIFGLIITFAGTPSFDLKTDLAYHDA